MSNMDRLYALLEQEVRVSKEQTVVFPVIPLYHYQFWHSTEFSENSNESQRSTDFFFPK